MFIRKLGWGQVAVVLVAIALFAALPVVHLCKTLRSSEAFVRDQISAAVRYLPGALVSSFFKSLSSEEVNAAKQKAGGFIKGVCHPSRDYEQVKDAGIQWIRVDIPFPFEKDGSIRRSYVQFKQMIQGYVDHGMKVMAVTPYPREYIRFGIDPRLPENEARVKEIAVFMMNDLRGLIGAVQITNEMGIPRFALPLTMDDAVRFIGMNLEAVYPVRGDVLIGYNTAGPQADQHLKMKPYLKYCDYVGIDLYIGCFTSVGNWMWVYDAMLRYVWSFTGKPVILCEFGYISGGAPKTAEEKKEILQSYGVESEAEARQTIEEFVARLPEKMKNQVYKNASGDWGNFVFRSDIKDHFYCELPAKTVIRGYPHTPEGQADFYRDIIPRLTDMPFLIGMFIYKYSDSEHCYVCGQADCPVETRWGLTTVDGQKKPTWFAVRDAFAKIP